MRIDAYTHFFPKKFFDMLNDVAADYKDMGKRVRSLPALYDLDVRKKIVDGHKDYQQILSYPQPAIEKFAKSGADIDMFCRVINDGFAELIAKEKDHFPGWVAHVSLAAPDAGVAEAERAVKELGALGVQIYTNVNGKPLDRPEYLPFWKKMNELGAPDLDASDPRRRDAGLYRRGQVALRNLVDVRLVLRDRDRDGAAGLLQDHRRPSQPEDHHPPFRRHRADARRPARPRQRRARLAHLGRRLCRVAQEPEEARARLLQEDFWADTAVFTAEPATKAGLEFFPRDKIVFASDCPFDPEGGTMYPRETLRILEIA